MTAEDLKNVLHEMGWSGAALGRRIGVSANTVSAWTSGGREVPRHVAEYLRVMRLAKQILA